MEHAASPAGNEPGTACYFKEIRKRDGRKVPFDPEKITAAIFKAVQAVGGSDRTIAEKLTRQVITYLQKNSRPGVVPAVEEVQDAVEITLIENGHARTAKAYILYRARRTRIREAKSELMDAVKEILVETSPENGAAGNTPAARMLQIALAASKRYHLANLLPEEYSRAHREGDLHIHGLGYYGQTLDCLQIDLARLLKEGFRAGYGFLRPPEQISGAAARAAVILQGAGHEMFGEQGFPHFDRDLGKAIRSFRVTPEPAEIRRAMQNLIYTLNCTPGQRPDTLFSVNLGDDTGAEGRAVSAALLEALEHGLGRGESPVLPRVVFRLREGVNFNPGDPNYDLYRLALRTAVRRSNPVFSFMDSTFNCPGGAAVSYMGCRSRVYGNRHGPDGSAGRGRIAAVTLNLPRLALESRGESDLFFIQLDRLLRLAARQLLHRFEVLSRLRVRDLPFLMGEGLFAGSAALAPDDSIGAVLKHGTLDLGFAGLAEALKLLAGGSHGESEAALELGLQIVEHMRRRTDQFANEFDLNFALLAGPAAGVARRFAALDRERFGPRAVVLAGDRYTDSFHLPDSYTGGAAGKIAVEGRFHRFCNAGHISYVPLEAPPADEAEAADLVVRRMAACDLGCGGIIPPRAPGAGRGEGA